MYAYLYYAQKFFLLKSDKLYSVAKKPLTIALC